MISAAPVPSMPRWEVIARWAAVPVAFLVAYPAALLLMAVVDALNAFDGIGESLSGAIMHSVTPFAATAMGSYYAVAFPAKVAPAFRLHVGARTKLGTALRKLVGRRFGRMTLREAGQDGKSKALLYRLEVAEPDAESPRGSREVPVVMALLPDSRSEPPEPSEPLSPPRARADHRTVQLHAQGDGVADQVPEVPEVPWLGSDEACSEAEPDRDLPRGDQKVPPRPRRCAGCAAAHSCGGCLRSALRYEPPVRGMEFEANPTS